MTGFPQFSQISISVGIQVFLEIEGLADRIKSKVIGYQSGEYLLVQLPLMCDLKHHLAPNGWVTMRYLHDGVVFGGRFRIIDAIARPFRLLFLSYPLRFENHNLRQKERIDCYILAKARYNDASFDGVVLDISCHGCRFATKHEGKGESKKVATGETLRLFFPLLGMEGDIEFGGVIRHIAEREDKIHLGVAFDRIDEDIKARIDDYVKRLGDYLA